MVKQNSTKAWWLAARPKTLAAAVAPVVVATALAYADFYTNWAVAALCGLFALLMQVAANFINDLFDFLKGTDGEERLGPERACAQGWIGQRAMKGGIAVTLALACLVGLTIVWASGQWVCIGENGEWVVLWKNVAALGIVGIACVFFAFLYTTMLSYCGLGDVLVYVFFGFVPVAGTYFVLSGTLSPAVWWVGAAQGLVTDTLLVLNNYRDRDTDRTAGKRTLIVTFGETFGSIFYLAQGILAVVCTLMLFAYGHNGLLTLLYLPIHIQTWRTMTRIHHGRELNKVLGLTARNILLFALLCALSLLI